MRLACLLLLLSAAPALAQAPPPHVLQAMRSPARIQVDGELGEAAWASAPACSAFTQRDPAEGAPPSQRTVVRVLYDDEALYVGAQLFDSSPDSIVSELSRHDQGTRSDRFTVYLDPLYDRRSGYYFGVNAAGTSFDGTLYNDGWSDDSWDAVWEARSHRTPEGWVAEMRIPFSQLRFGRAEMQRWGINFQREMGRGFENDYLVCHPKDQSGFVSWFAPLEGLHGIEPSSAIELVPYVTSKGEFVRAAPRDPFHDGSEMSPNAGGDLRMPVGSKLTLNATVNPDFGQVEVDPEVVNLSDVETFFPEKRPFFVEGSSIFDAGQQGASDYWGFNFPSPIFFYSRRIGRAPEGGVPGDAVFSDVPDGTTILGAGKLSGKLGHGLNVGTLHAVTSREQARIELGDSSRAKAEVEPLAYYGAFRVLKEFRERRNGLGLLTTVTERDLAGSRLADAYDRAALTTVIDGWHFLGADKRWVLSGYAAGSLVTGSAARIADLQTGSRHYFQRPDAKTRRFDPAATTLAGSSARVWLNKEKGDWFSNSAIGYLSPGFEVNDMGFMSRADLVNGHAGFGRKWDRPSKWFKNQRAMGAVFGSTNFDGDIVAAGVWSRWFAWYPNNWTTNISTAYNPRTVNARRSRGGPLMQNAPGYELNLFFDTDGSRKRYYNASFYEYLQPEENSFVYQLYPFFNYKPRANLAVSIGPGYESSRDGAFYVTALDDPAATATYGQRYVFARLDQQTLSANVRLNVSFTPTMSLQFYGQPLVSAGRYSDYRELARPRSLDFTGPGAGAWTYDPAERAFDPDGAGPAAPEHHDFNTRSLRGNLVFRWEYAPGSALYLVWTQQRSSDAGIPDLDPGGSLRQLFDAHASNIVLAKLTYYLSR